MTVRLLVVATALGCVVLSAAAQGARPAIRKLGTIDCDMVETNPVVFNNRLYRFEYVRATRYAPNTTGESYFRFIDVATGAPTPAFAKGCHLGSAYVLGETMYAYGVDAWGGQHIKVFWSKDLDTWESRTALELPGWQIFNNSVCSDASRHIMAFEIGAPPEETGAAFTMRFATSDDLIAWTLTPPECVYTKERYSACGDIHYLDGYYYMIYLEALPGCWEPYLVRSKDLIHWESSPYNPVIQHSDEDRRIANAALTDEQRKRIETATNANNSDVGLCEFEGRTVLYYSWGDQHGTEHLAEAVYDGGVKALLEGFFPSPSK
ncbi:MAG TPA: hypothetical protein PLO37_15895 [Candidatus Hydrogenedentes bacterium]|nr:hypothetical protein [Candidatus Hydrogenedentota bacterium]HPG68329.1 hypothetical protein [Candidatus Hydrogenedentota bacterium]